MLEICTRPNLLKHVYRRNSRYILFVKGEEKFSITDLILKRNLCGYTIGHFTSLYQLLGFLFLYLSHDDMAAKDESGQKILQEEIKTYARS
jgi:hypothetical protein